MFLGGLAVERDWLHFRFYKCDSRNRLP